MQHPLTAMTSPLRCMRATGEFTSVYSFFALDDTGFGPRQPYQVGRVRPTKSMLTEDKANRVHNSGAQFQP
jgi:hypothetical protein